MRERKRRRGIRICIWKHDVVRLVWQCSTGLACLAVHLHPGQLLEGDSAITLADHVLPEAGSRINPAGYRQVAELFAALLGVGSEEAGAAVVEAGVLGRSLALVLRYPFNNVLHAQARSRPRLPAVQPRHILERAGAAAQAALAA